MAVNLLRCARAVIQSDISLLSPCPDVVDCTLLQEFCTQNKFGAHTGKFDIVGAGVRLAGGDIPLRFK